MLCKGSQALIFNLLPLDYSSISCNLSKCTIKELLIAFDSHVEEGEIYCIFKLNQWSAMENEEQEVFNDVKVFLLFSMKLCRPYLCCCQNDTFSLRLKANKFSSVN